MVYLHLAEAETKADTETKSDGIGFHHNVQKCLDRTRLEINVSFHWALYTFYRYKISLSISVVQCK